MALQIFLSNALLSALSIANLGMISSMVGFLHDQEDNVGAYQVNWPDQTVALNVVPEHLWTDHGHESNGVAGYGFFLGLFGLFVAWRQRKRKLVCPRTAKQITILILIRVSRKRSLRSSFSNFLLSFLRYLRSFSFSSSHTKHGGRALSPTSPYQTSNTRPISGHQRRGSRPYLNFRSPVKTSTTTSMTTFQS